MNRIFDPKRRRLQQVRASRRCVGGSFLENLITDALCDRLSDMTRKFEIIAIQGINAAENLAALRKKTASKQHVHLQQDCSLALNSGSTINCDTELLALKNNSFDAFFSLNSMHTVNDLPGMLTQIRAALKPDGLLLAAFPGGHSLWQLRHCLLQAEEELTGRACSRIFPMIDVKTAGQLLQRCGYALPASDLDRFELSYRSVMHLINDMRDWGETNCMTAQPLSKAVFLRAAEHYQEQFAREDGKILITLEFIHLSGWKPHKSQQKAKKPGSAHVALKDFLQGK